MRLIGETGSRVVQELPADEIRSLQFDCLNSIYQTAIRTEKSRANNLPIPAGAELLAKLSIRTQIELNNLSVATGLKSKLENEENSTLNETGNDQLTKNSSSLALKRECVSEEASERLSQSFAPAIVTGNWLRSSHTLSTL